MSVQKKTKQEFEKYIESIKKMAKEEGYDTLDDAYVEHLRCRFFDQDVIIGEGARVILREMKMSDLEAFYAFEDACTEPVLRPFIKKSMEESIQNLQAYIAHMYPLYDYGMWSVVEKENGTIIGICGIGHNDYPGAECTDLGYYICPKWRKKGIATECIEIVLDYAKNYLEFPLICAIIKEENRISRGILRKFGFEFVKKLESSDGKISVYERKLGNGNE